MSCDTESLETSASTRPSEQPSIHSSGTLLSQPLTQRRQKSFVGPADVGLSSDTETSTQKVDLKVSESDIDAPGLVSELAPGVTQSATPVNSSTAIEVMAMTQGFVTAVKLEPREEDKLEWHALRQRIHLAFSKTCKRWPSLSVQFKLAGTSKDCLEPTIFFVCPLKTQSSVKKFLRRQKWLAKSECGYNTIVIDGSFLRVALDDQFDLNRGPFVYTSAGKARDFCGQAARLDSPLNRPNEIPRFTIGGVLLINDVPCCLTTGHVLLDTSQDGNSSDSSVSSEEDESGDEDSGQSSNPVPDTSQFPLEVEAFSARGFRSKDGPQPNLDRTEQKIGKLLTTSDWKRGLLVQNQDWSLIKLEKQDFSANSMINQYHDPHQPLESPVTFISSFANPEEVITHSEITIVAGISGLQGGWLNTTPVQLYLDNRVFEAREITTEIPLGVSCLQITVIIACFGPIVCSMKL